MKNIYDIRKMMGLNKEHDFRYYGTYATGKFDALEDYGAGILSVSISASRRMKDKWGVMFSLGTIDDGNWQALDVREDYSSEQAIARVKEIADAFDSYMDRFLKLPTEEELNKFLMTVELWGEYVG